MDIMGSTIILLAAVYMHHINTTTFVINTCKKVLDICINTWKNIFTGALYAMINTAITNIELDGMNQMVAQYIIGERNDADAVNK